MTPAQAREAVREARRRLAISDPAWGPLLSALVRGSDAELLALAAAHPEPKVDPATAQPQAPDSAEHLPWLAGMRERYREGRGGGAAPPPRPAQGGLWRAA